MLKSRAVLAVLTLAALPFAAAGCSRKAPGGQEKTQTGARQFKAVADLDDPALHKSLPDDTGPSQGRCR